MKTMPTARRCAAAAAAVACLTLGAAPSALAETTTPESVPSSAATTSVTPETTPATTTSPAQVETTSTVAPAPSETPTTSPATQTPAPAGTTADTATATTSAAVPTTAPSSTPAPTTAAPSSAPATLKAAATPVPASAVSPTTAAGLPGDWDGDLLPEDIPSVEGMPLTPLPRDLRITPGCKQITVVNPAGNPKVAVAYGSITGADADGVVVIAPGGRATIATRRTVLVVAASDGKGLSYLDGGRVDQRCGTATSPVVSPASTRGLKDVRPAGTRTTPAASKPAASVVFDAGL